MGHDAHDGDHHHPPHDEHAHPHAHGHSHRHAPRDDREPLARGAGAGKTLYLDAPSGLSGDMIVSTLVDLGVPATVIAEAVAAVPITGFHLHFGTRTRSGIVAGSFEVHVDDPQPERTYGAVKELLEGARLEAKVKARAHATFRRLAESEARVHKTAIDEVHFHEVGAVDAVADVVGSAAALDWIGAELLVSPLPLGRGFTRARHGRIPLPPPAVVECLASFETYDGGLDFEFVTPTGAAIVAAHARGSSRWPAMSPIRAGWGSGSADLADRPNLLRAVLGDPTPAPAASPPAGTHLVIEANIDDATGEIMGGAIEALLAAGALDAWTSPVTMKKGRPAWVVSAIAEPGRASDVVHALLRETPSIGVRQYPVSRVERPRTMLTVETAFGPLPVKVSSGPFGPPQVKPEYDACLAAARAHHVPVREVVQAALAEGLRQVSLASR